MSSLGLTLFTDLVEVGNVLEALRDTYVPESDQWLWHTEALGMLDQVIDLLVLSEGLEEDSDDC